MDQILSLNGMNQDTPLLIGQEVVVALPDAKSPTEESGAASQPPIAEGVGGQPAPTGAPAAETTPGSPAAAPGPALSAGEGTGELCVRAFTDSDGDGVMNPDENLVGGVVFILQGGQGAVAATRTTDGLSEPYCFVQPAGAYSLLIQTPAGRVATSDTRWGLVLAAGAPVNIDFGSRPAADASLVTSRRAPEDGAGRALSGLAGIALVTAAVAGLFWVLRARFARGGRL